MTWRKQWKIAKVFGPLRLTWEIWMKLLAPAFRLICCWLLWPSRECATRWKRSLYLSVLLSLQFFFFILKTYLCIYLKVRYTHTCNEKERHQDRDLCTVHWFTSQHCPNIGPLFAVFPDILAGSWMERGTVGTPTGTPSDRCSNMGCCYTRDSFTWYATMPAHWHPLKHTT